MFSISTDHHFHINSSNPSNDYQFVDTKFWNIAKYYLKKWNL